MTTTTEPGTAGEARLDAGAADADGEDLVRVDVSRRERYVSEYAELSRHILASGLLERRYAYYWFKIIGLIAAFVAIWVVFVLLGNSWFQLMLAAALAVVLAQFGFLDTMPHTTRSSPLTAGTNGPRGWSLGSSLG
jgi:hypothetical protein